MGSPRWDIFDREGRYLGALTFPDRFELRQFRDGRVYGVIRDELDIPYLVALELDGRLDGVRVGS